MAELRRDESRKLPPAAGVMANRILDSAPIFVIGV
jgi:hypothetical protein